MKKRLLILMTVTGMIILGQSTPILKICGRSCALTALLP